MYTARHGLLVAFRRPHPYTHAVQHLVNGAQPLLQTQRAEEADLQVGTEREDGHQPPGPRGAVRQTGPVSLDGGHGA